jgi:RNA polymerase sigma factor (sigma-70 family)
VAQAERSDDSAAMDAILRRFEKLAFRIAAQTTFDPLLQDDARNAARLGLVRAVRAHDLTVAGFASFAERYVSGEARRTVRRAGRVVNREHVRADDDPIWIDRVGCESQPSDDGYPHLVSGLSSAQRTLARARYVDDRSLQQIAAELGTSVSAVSQRLSTIHKVVLQSLALAA